MTARGAAGYAAMFEGLRRRDEGAFVPFLVVGDPDPDTSLDLLRTLARSGADALELGLPFSDPVADGPVIQAAATRALTRGLRLDTCWEIVATVRREFPELPIGLLVYANLVLGRDPEAFYRRAARAGVDSVLVADLPVREAPRVHAVSREAGVAPILIAPPNAGPDRLAQIARGSEGYVYVVSRAGVTGADDRIRDDGARLLAALRGLGSAPPLLGFGISRPEHVRAALRMGAAGAISGSAVVAHIPGLADRREELLAAVGDFVAGMKAATRSPT